MKKKFISSYVYIDKDIQQIIQDNIVRTVLFLREEFKGLEIFQKYFDTVENVSIVSRFETFSSYVNFNSNQHYFLEKSYYKHLRINFLQASDSVITCLLKLILEIFLGIETIIQSEWHIIGRLCTLLKIRDFAR